MTPFELRLEEGVAVEESEQQISSCRTTQLVLLVPQEDPVSHTQEDLLSVSLSLIQSDTQAYNSQFITEITESQRHKHLRLLITAYGLNCQRKCLKH